MGNKDKNGNHKKTMKFGTRIVIAFAAIVIIPVAVIMFIYSFTLTHSRGHYGFDEEDVNSVYSSASLLLERTDDEFDELKKTAETDSAMLQDRGYLDKLNEELEEDDAFLAVRVGDRITYVGSDRMSAEQLEKLMPDYGDERLSSNEWTVILTDYKVLVRQTDFISAEGDKSSAFVIIDMNKIFPGLKQWVGDLVLISLIGLVITVFAITLWLYWGISKPIQKLKTAAQHIRDGDLDFAIGEESSVREINELCEDFEEMRKRLKSTQEEKMSADSENHELIRNISHDLKTPITAVKGYCEGIMDGVADTPEKLNKYIRTIYNKSTEMDRLINELTYYSKIDTNRMPYTFTKINVNEYFADCSEELELEMERERVDFMYKNTLKEDTVIIADAEQLRRVIHNIINNSVKYMDKPERRIEMRISDEEDFIKVEIEDNGKGIAKKDRQRVFDRFYRTDASRNSTRGGSGIGLSIVKKILEDHGGKVWVGGEEGKGTIMNFILRKYQEMPYHE